MNLSHLYAVIQPLNRTYFREDTIKTTTAELRNPEVLQEHLDNGFVYIRRLNFNYNHILRSPTDGCHVELTKVQEIGSFPIDSPKARKLIRRLCYF